MRDTQKDKSFDLIKEEYEHTICDLNEKLKVHEQNMKAREEQMKQAQSSLKKENAILKQKMGFLDLELNDARQQIEDQKRAHDSIIKAFESTTVNDSSSQLDE